MKADIALFAGRLKINKIFLLAAIGMCFFIGVSTFTAFAAAIILHEAAHCIAASALGLAVYELRVMPYGCEAAMDEFMLSGSKGIAVAAAGPAVNIICAAGAYMAARAGYAGEFMFDFINTNTLLAAINLLPAMPLDGGRIVKEIIALSASRKKAENICYTMGAITAVCIIASGIYIAFEGIFNPTFFIMGCFLLYSSILHKKTPEYNAIVNKSRKQNIKTMDVKQIAVRKDVSAGNVMKMFSYGKYNVVYVLDDDLSILFKIGEGDFIRAVVKYGANCSMEKLVFK